jgi:hypothetical protein
MCIPRIRLETQKKNTKLLSQDTHGPVGVRTGHPQNTNPKFYRLSQLINSSWRVLMFRWRRRLPYTEISCEFIASLVTDILKGVGLWFID